MPVTGALKVRFAVHGDGSMKILMRGLAPMTDAVEHEVAPPDQAWSRVPKDMSEARGIGATLFRYLFSDHAAHLLLSGTLGRLSPSKGEIGALIIIIPRVTDAGMPPPALAALHNLHTAPWELLYDTNSSQRLQTGRVAIIRAFDDVGHFERAYDSVGSCDFAVERPLFYHRLDTAEEETALSNLNRRGKSDVFRKWPRLHRRYDRTSAEAKAIGPAPAWILHVACHGTATDQLGTPGLIVRRGWFGRRIINVESFQDVLLYSRTLITLSACYSGARSTSPRLPYDNFADALLREKTRYLLCNLRPIGDDTAGSFATTFYTGLLGGLSFVESLWHARERLRLGDEMTTDWSQPVAYVRNHLDFRIRLPRPLANANAKEPPAATATASDPIRELEYARQHALSLIASARRSRIRQPLVLLLTGKADVLERKYVTVHANRSPNVRDVQVLRDEYGAFSKRALRLVTTRPTLGDELSRGAMGAGLGITVALLLAPHLQAERLGWFATRNVAAIDGGPAFAGKEALLVMLAGVCGAILGLARYVGISLYPSDRIWFQFPVAAIAAWLAIAASNELPSLIGISTAVTATSSPSSVAPTVPSFTRVALAFLAVLICCCSLRSTSRVLRLLAACGAAALVVVVLGAVTHLYAGTINPADAYRIYLSACFVLASAYLLSS